MHERPFKCPHCSSAFGIEFCLEDHINRIHNTIKEIKCEKCKEMFSSQNLLKEHNKVGVAKVSTSKVDDVPNVFDREKSLDPCNH